MSKFLSERFSSLEEYTPGEQPKNREYIKLNTNESPYPPSELVINSITNEEIGRLNLYPDPDIKVLKQKLANYYNVLEENVFVANGSDDILNFSFMAFCDKDHGAIFPDITYGFYSVFANLYNIPFAKIPLNADFTINYKDYLNSNNMVVIANPNAPTGINLSLSNIEEIVKSNPHNVVIIDEAYVDFGGTTSLELIKKYPNLLVCRTFSKSRSMAGARLGYAFAQKELINDLEKIRFSTNPYNINRLSMLAGVMAIESHDYYTDKINKICATRENTVKVLKTLDFEILDSCANFIFAKHSNKKGIELYTKLKDAGILVRHFNKDRISDFIRITIGTDEEMNVFFDTIKTILELR